jgi:peptidoglycan pentaglycine glycine transferase (the first glycine)
MTRLPPPPSPAVWNAIIAGLPGSHLLQTSEWAQVKATIGWDPYYLVWCEHPSGINFHINRWPRDQRIQAAALVLQRTIPIGGFAARLCILYSPKGPLLDWSNAKLRNKVINDLQTFAKKKGAIFLKIDPDVFMGSGLHNTSEFSEDATGFAIQDELNASGWRYSPDQIQFRNSVILDLTGSEDFILGRMKQKTRYNIHLASRKGVSVRLGNSADYPLLYRMYAETSLRDGFAIRDKAYYYQVWSTFAQSSLTPATTHPIAFPLIAEVGEEPVAAIVLFLFARRAWYLYGMSREIHRDKMPNYLLQWEAIRLCRSNGCDQYDLWGAPEVNSESDPLWGVYRFKAGLGGNFVRFIGAWDFPARPVFYHLYTQTLPRLLEMMRRQGKTKIRQIAG